MRLARKHRQLGVKIGIAPLVDVILLLIIFFMTVTQITSFEIEPLDLPDAQTGTAVETSPVHRVIVNVQEDGMITVAKDEYTTEELELYLIRQRQSATDGEVEVLLRGDRHTPWDQVAGVMTACAQAGIAKVKVAVLSGSDEGGF